MKKLVSLLCAVILVLSLSAAAFADTPKATFDPNSILNPPAPPVPTPTPVPDVMTLDEYIDFVDEEVDALRVLCTKGVYLEVPADEYMMRFFVDPEGTRDANGLLPIVRIDAFQTNLNPYIKSYYYSPNGNLFNAHFRTEKYENGDQDIFYFKQNDSVTPEVTELLLMKYRPANSSRFNILDPNHPNYTKIQTDVLNEANSLLQDAKDQLQALHNLGLY